MTLLKCKRGLIRGASMYLYDKSRLTGFVAAGRYLMKKKPDRYSFWVDRHINTLTYRIRDKMFWASEWCMMLTLKNYILPKRFKK